MTQPGMSATGPGYSGPRRPQRSAQSDGVWRRHDLRPIGYLAGLLVAALGATMFVPMTVDLLSRTATGRSSWKPRSSRG